MANENEVLAKALVMSELKRNGQIGYTEPGKKLFTIELTDGQYLDATRKSGSLEIGKTYTVAVDGETYTCKGKDGSEIDADVCLGNFGLAGGTDTGEPFFVMETFDNGTDNVWVLGAMTNNGASTISVSIADTIHPLKPEYLPEEVKPTVVDFDELGVTGIVLELANTGGGQFAFGSYGDAGEEASEAMCKAIPQGRPYVVKLTMPGSYDETMYVAPVYTTFDVFGFFVAHFDSYLVTESGLTKFYVRLYRGTRSENFGSGMIEVGFY